MYHVALLGLHDLLGAVGSNDVARLAGVQVLAGGVLRVGARVDLDRIDCDADARTPRSFANGVDRDAPAPAAVEWQCRRAQYASPQALAGASDLALFGVERHVHGDAAAPRKVEALVAAQLVHHVERLLGLQTMRRSRRSWAESLAVWLVANELLVLLLQRIAQ